MTGRLHTARDVADQLGVSTETVLRWTRRGQLPALRLPGGALRYRETDIERWLMTLDIAPPTTNDIPLIRRTAA